MAGQRPPRPLATHVFVEHPDEPSDPVTGVQYCARCHLPYENRRHQTAPRTRARDESARWLGERDGGD